MRLGVYACNVIPCDGDPSSNIVVFCRFYTQRCAVHGFLCSALWPIREYRMSTDMIAVGKWFCLEIAKCPFRSK